MLSKSKNYAIIRIGNDSFIPNFNECVKFWKSDPRQLLVMLVKIEKLKKIPTNKINEIEKNILENTDTIDISDVESYYAATDGKIKKKIMREWFCA